MENSRRSKPQPSKRCDAGAAVLSLRPDGEPPSRNASRPWPEYHLEEERVLAEASGLRFRNVPLTDFSAPPPDGVASALRVIDALVAERPGVYVHCRAGAGRAGLISASWAVTRGQSGDDAAESYLRFMEHIVSTRNLTDDEWAAFARRVGQPQVWGPSERSSTRWAAQCVTFRRACCRLRRLQRRSHITGRPGIGPRYSRGRGTTRHLKRSTERTLTTHVASAARAP